MNEFQQATEEFLKELDYYGELDAATLMSIRVAARELDANFRTTLLTEYRRQLDAIKAYGGIQREEEPDALLSPVLGLHTRGASLHHSPTS